MPAICLALLSVFAATPADAAGPAELMAAVREGRAFAIMRHAYARGIGDPANFSLGDCSTQRNLSDQGRTDARATGGLFKRHGITQAAVYSSAWCRCRDTATALGLGPVETLPALNSFFRSREHRTSQTAALRRWLTARDGGEPLILVSHQVNISALTGQPTRSGEIVVATIDRSGVVDVLGTIDQP
ncbi:MAG: histidine phosphatase family protein [Alphaproteobacteria bacterium]|nr:histidine phosphatase family protein [Alphaproteobacteria bacterium]